jgi:hypothetical protein
MCVENSCTELFDSTARKTQSCKDVKIFLYEMHGKVFLKEMRIMRACGTINCNTRCVLHVGKQERVHSKFIQRRVSVGNAFEDAYASK